MGFKDTIQNIFKSSSPARNQIAGGGLTGSGLDAFNINNNDGFMPLQINPDGKPQNDIAKYTTIYHLNRVRQDIMNWRNAVLEMEQIYIPHRVKVQLLYEDTALNAQVQASMRKRKNLVLLKDFQIVDKSGKKDEVTTKLFNQHWFYNIENYILDAQFYGYSLINWTNIKNGVPADIKIIRRQFISPDRRIISPFPYSLMGHSIDSDDITNWSLYVDTPNQHGLSPCGYGLLYECANYEIILRNLMGYNADYIEKYGMPITVVDTMKTDDDERKYLEDMIKTLGSSGYIIKDPQDTVTLQGYDNVGVGFQSYADLEERLEKKISKLILGHADALDSTPGKLGGSQGEESPTPTDPSCLFFIRSTKEV